MRICIFEGDSYTQERLGSSIIRETETLQTTARFVNNTDTEIMKLTTKGYSQYKQRDEFRQENDLQKLGGSRTGTVSRTLSRRDEGEKHAPTLECKDGISGQKQDRTIDTSHLNYKQKKYPVSLDEGYTLGIVENQTQWKASGRGVGVQFYQPSRVDFSFAREYMPSLNNVD